MDRTEPEKSQHTTPYIILQAFKEMCFSIFLIWWSIIIMSKFLYFPISRFNLLSQFLWGTRSKFYPEKLSYNICSSLSVTKLNELISIHTSNNKLQVHQLSLKRNAYNLYPQPVFIYHTVTTYCLFLQFSTQVFFPPA